MPERRVVITGMGVITPVGNNLETFWSNLKNGVSGIHTIDAFDTTEYDCKIGGQVRDFDAKQFFKNPKDVRRTDRFTHLAMAAAKMAVADSGIDINNLKERDRFGVIVSTGIGGLKTLQDQLQILLTKGPGRNSPFTIPMLISNMAGGVISMEFNLRGPNLCIVTACATSNNAIGESWRIIKFGDAEVFLAGGAEASIVEIGVAGFSAMKALSKRNDEPERASRPFDRDRDGFVMSEGSGVVVVEELEHAKARGAKIYCEITGYGVSADAYHMTAPPPDGEGAARAMKMALDHARISPEQVDYINAHATSTDIGDLCETRAIKQLFGEYADKVSHQCNEIDDRPLVRGRRWNRDGCLRTGHPRLCNSAHHQLWKIRAKNATSITRPTLPAKRKCASPSIIPLGLAAITPRWSRARLKVSIRRGDLRFLHCNRFD